MTTEHAAELAMAIEAARGAGAIQLERYERLERIVHKGPKDVVTEVDHLCEELILGAIRSHFPDDVHRGTYAHAAADPHEDRVAIDVQQRGRVVNPDWGGIQSEPVAHHS